MGEKWGKEGNSVKKGKRKWLTKALQVPFIHPSLSASLLDFESVSPAAHCRYGVFIVMRRALFHQKLLFLLGAQHSHSVLTVLGSDTPFPMHLHLPLVARFHPSLLLFFVPLLANVAGRSLANSEECTTGRRVGRW